MTDSNWCTIESDPGVFTELIERLGVKDSSVKEIWSLDAVEDQLKENTYGLIYLFKHRQEQDNRPVVDVPEGMVFAKQVVHNACATQAILSILMNTETLDIGEMLGEFKGFATALDSESLGMTIGTHDGIREIHNMFAQPEPFVQDPDKKKDHKGPSEDVFHFVAYIPFGDKVYELDGLKTGPVYLGEFSEGAGRWFDVAGPAIQERMARHAEDISSCLLSVGKCGMVLTQEKIDQLVSSGNAEAMAAEISELQTDLQGQQAQREAQKAENVRRRHNYFPLIMNLLGRLASNGDLQPMVGAAKEKKSAAVAAAAADAAAGGKK